MGLLFILGFLVFWLTTIFIVCRLGRRQDETISFHFARKKWSTITFMIADIVTIVLLSVAFFGWLGPNFNLSVFSYVLTGIILLQWLIVGIFPHTTGKVAKIHFYTAWSMVFLMMFFIVDILVETFSATSLVTKIILSLFIVAGLGLGVFKAVSGKKFQKHILIYESIYFFGFFATPILISYL